MPTRPAATPAAPPGPDLVAVLQAEVRRLADRLARVEGRVERVEDSVELVRDGAEKPLAWPVSVSQDSPLEVPPVEVSRRPSPAFDILLGAPAHPAATARRDSA